MEYVRTNLVIDIYKHLVRPVLTLCVTIMGQKDIVRRVL